MASSDASLARASLDSLKHSFIDAFLRSLKLHTRKLGALFAQHATELLVLERIYYINNNQHRAALFWKRVVEARRYSRRLMSCDVSSLVNGLRRSFHDQSDVKSKSHKGAWSHYPSASSLNLFLERLRTCIALLDKTCVRLCAIYRMLTLAMRSGAFLHLVVTLTALVARLAHLSSALRHVLSALHAESICLLDTLHPAEATHKATPLPPAPLLDGDDAEVPSALLASTGRVVPDSDLDMSVDLGEAIARSPTFTPRPRSTPPMVLDLLLPTHSVRSAVPVPVVEPCRLATGDVPPTLPQPLPLNRPSHPAVMVKRRATAPEEPRQKRRTKGKKAQRDEIDDIFS
ncbi:hypothetical protein EDB87DRAFT_1594469 [Lactarius vividus]|nr:hypothetical protein EDB87DRAFT_1594469 [Lactarius vividus]